MGPLHHFLLLDSKKYFFDDKTEKGGNDYPIVERLEREKRDMKIFTVSSPNETLEILQKLNY